MITKVLTIVDLLDKGGVQRVAQVFAEAYCDLGKDSRILAIKGGGVRESFLQQRKISYWLGITDEILREIEQWNPDLIHLHSHGFSHYDYSKFRSLLIGRKVVEQNVFSRPNPWTHEMALSLQLSIWCLWRFRRECNYSLPTQVAVVPNPANIASFSKKTESEVASFRGKYSIEKDSILLGRIGQSYKAKWSALLIESFEKISVKHKNINLLLVNPPLNIIEQAQKSFLKDKIVIIDKIIGDDELSVAYSAIDIFCLAAEQGESFGNVIVESMLCETPVVALSTPWRDNSQCEVVGHMKGGLVTHSPKGFREAIKTLINDKNLRLRLGKSGREKAVADYESKKVAQLVLDLAKDEDKTNFQEQLDRSILEIFTNSFDKASPLSKFILKKKKLYLGLTRYTSGYESCQSLWRDIHRKLKAFM